MWLVYLKYLYDGSTLVKVLVWLFILYLIGGLLYQTWGWAGVIIPLLVIIGLIVYWLKPSKEERQHRKLEKERMSLNNEIKAMHPYATIVEIRDEQSLPRLYELEIENSQKVNNPLFDIHFRLLSDSEGFEVRILNKSSSEIEVNWATAKIDNFETFVRNYKWIKHHEKDSIPPKKQMRCLSIEK